MLHEKSRSIIAEEGDILELLISRSRPAFGKCKVYWESNLVGSSGKYGLNESSGITIFYPNETEGRIFLKVLDDSIPEVNEGYYIQLIKVVTEGFLLYYICFNTI